MQAGLLSARDKVEKEEKLGRSKVAIWRIALSLWAI